MYKRILVPLDGSELGECTLEHVKTLATGCHVLEIELLYVIEPPPEVEELPYAPILAADEKQHAWAKNYLDEVEKELQKDGLASKQVIKEGRPADVIISYASFRDDDLIVMSTHGRSGVSRWALGSVADRVIHYATVPVFLVAAPGCRLT